MASATPAPSDTTDLEVGRLYPLARKVLSPVFHGLWRIRVTGAEHIPHDGPAIFCPNHCAAIDSFFLPLALPRRITFVGKAEYLDSWKTKHLFPALGMIPIDRSGGSASERALNTAARVLESGGYFGIYPEGTRSRDGRLHRGHTGPARLALRTGAPIVPVGLVGTREIQPPERRMPRPFRSVEIRFARPISVERYRDRADDRLLLRQLIDEVMFEIRELTGQEYVDEYATKKPEAFPTAAPTHVVPVDQVTAGNGAAGTVRRSSAEVLSQRPA